MKEVMLSETPIEEREQILRDSCDQIVEKSYTRKFGQKELNERRRELSEKAIKLNNLRSELDEIKAEYKQRMKPIEDRFNRVRDEIKAGGEYVTKDCFKFIDQEEGKTAWYNPEGYKIEERDSTPDEKQRTVFQAMRSTGTND